MSQLLRAHCCCAQTKDAKAWARPGTCRSQKHGDGSAAVWPENQMFAQFRPQRDFLVRPGRCGTRGWARLDPPPHPTASDARPTHPTRPGEAASAVQLIICDLQMMTASRELCSVFHARSTLCTSHAARSAACGSREALSKLQVSKSQLQSAASSADPPP